MSLMFYYYCLFIVGTNEYFGPVIYTAVNYCLLVIGIALIVAMVTSLIVIHLWKRHKEKCEHRQELLKRRRKGIDYRRPSE